MTDDTVRWRLDLLLGTAFAAFVPFTVLSLGVSGGLRAALALPLLLFVPGYAFLAAVYPERWSESENTRESEHALVSEYLNAGIAPGERLLLAVLLSAGLSPAVALVLNFTPLRIRPAPLFVAIAGLSIVMFVVAYARRAALASGTRSGVGTGYVATVLGDKFTVHTPTLLDDDRDRATSRREVLLNVVVAVGVIAVCAGAAFAYVAPTADPQFTEFYVVGQNESGNYTVNAVPATMAAGEEQPVYPSITNQAGETHEYTVVAELQRVERTDGDVEVTSQRTLATFEQAVDPGETERVTHNLGPFEPGSEYRVVYLLYVGDPPSDPTQENARRSLRVWLTVTGDGSAAVAAGGASAGSASNWNAQGSPTDADASDGGVS